MENVAWKEPRPSVEKSERNEFQNIAAKKEN
jgi:hypothetical protein